MNTNKTITVAIGVLCGFFCSVSAEAFSWAPINPDELKMTSEPKAPGASAIILELQVDRDDQEYKVSIYERIKILTDDGRKYGDVEVEYEKGDESVRYIEARTILPDGKVINFDGKIYDRLIVKGRDLRYQAKTFTLPQVQTGAIIEFRYVKYLPGYFSSSRWVLSDELFIKHAKYSLAPNIYFAMHGTWPRGLPPDTEPPKEKNSMIRLETHDVPAFITEDYMPPAIELKYRVDFVYNTLRVSEKENPAKFWQEAGKKWNEFSNEFMNKRHVMEQTVARLFEPGDSDETKLRKIYAHVQGLRNLSFEKDKTLQEEKRDKTKEVEDVADVEKYGYGDAVDLTFLYVALARAAGFNADIGWISTRDQYFFEPGAMNPTQLTSNIAVVTVGGKEIFIEPGVPFVPFGTLPWEESGVSGLRLNKQGGSWFKTPLMQADQAVTKRRASLKLEDGSLVGTVTVTYTGLEAVYHRLEERFDDDTDRKDYLQNELKRVIPSGSEVTLTNSPDWQGVGTPLVVEYKLKVPGWASTAGKRMLMPVGLFGADEKHTFEHEKRLHPIYFHYASTVADEIDVELPAGWQAVSIPRSHDENISLTAFSSSVESAAGVVKIKRELNVNGVLLSEKYYLALQDFYKTVRSSDEEQIILTTGSVPGGTPAQTRKP